MDLQAIVNDVLSGDTRATARACRIADDELPGSTELLDALDARAPPSWLLGVTGSPGVGKSTLVSRLIGEFRLRLEQVAVIAVDPTSPITGGAVLGDRVRMQEHFQDPGVFIRSVATRGQLGGLSRSTLALSRILSAWGARVVIIETVGVGQSEVDVARTADTTLVVMAPGLGDEVQAAKAGLLESADVFAINKADRPQAHALVAMIEAMIADGQVASVDAGPAPLGHAATHSSSRSPTTDDGVGSIEGPWSPPVCSCVASKGEGIVSLLAALDRHRAWFESTEAGRAARSNRQRGRLHTFLKEASLLTVWETLSGPVQQAVARVEAREMGPFSACRQLKELACRFRSS